MASRTVTWWFLSWSEMMSRHDRWTASSSISRALQCCVFRTCAGYEYGTARQDCSLLRLVGVWVLRRGFAHCLQDLRVACFRNLLTQSDDRDLEPPVISVVKQELHLAAKV